MKQVATAVIGMAALLGGCATPSLGSGPVEVSRFHLGAPLPTGTIVVEPIAGGGPVSLEFQAYADAVRAQLLSHGYTDAPAGTPGQYLAVVGFQRSNQPAGPARSPVSIGLGGGGSTGGYRGGGVGLGGGLSFPLGSSRPREAIVSGLSVQIRRRTDGTAIWEGRAQTYADAREPDSQANASAAKLSRALFLDFPGESGRTITIK